MKHALVTAEDVVLSDATAYLYCSDVQQCEPVLAIPDSVYCDVNRLGTLKSLKGFLASQKLQEKTLVCYQSAGVKLAAQTWWLLQVIGHDSVKVLDGGLQAYTSAGGRTTLLPIVPTAELSVDAEVDRSKYKVDSELRALISANSRNFQIIDTDGRCLGAINCSYEVIVTDTENLLDRESLKVIFAGLGIRYDPQLTTIVIGKSAPVVLLALAVLGMTKLCLGIVKRDGDEFLKVEEGVEDGRNSVKTEFFSVSGNTEYFDAKADEERSIRRSAMLPPPAKSSQVAAKTSSRKPAVPNPSNLHESRETQHTCSSCSLL